MTNFLYVALLLLLSNSAFAVFTEDHLECEPYAAKIEQLNQKNAPYYSYSVWASYSYDEDKEIPTCSFRKETSGGVDLEIEITNQSTFVEINNKLKAFTEKLYDLSVDEKKECSYSDNSYSLRPLAKSPDKHILKFYGKVVCYSFVGDLNALENLDIEKLLIDTIKGTDFKFEISAEPSPVISGTTIHN